MFRALAREVAAAFRAHPVAAPALTGAAALLVAKMHDPSSAAASAGVVGAVGVGLLGYAGIRAAGALAEGGATAALRGNPTVVLGRGESRVHGAKHVKTPKAAERLVKGLPGFYSTDGTVWAATVEPTTGEVLRFQRGGLFGFQEFPAAHYPRQTAAALAKAREAPPR